MTADKCEALVLILAMNHDASSSAFGRETAG
jgi:hypothetical protein